MKILQVHNYYKQRGGEANVVENEKLLLEQNENTVDTFYVHSSELKGAFAELKTAFEMPFSKKYFEISKDRIKSVKPDVIHVHNTFPIISPSIFYAAKELGVPTIFTLHNYRLIYPNALLMHNGKIDRRTINGSAKSVVSDKVYKDSILKTYAVARLIEFHKKKNTWNTKVDKFISLTAFAKNVFTEWGIDNNRIVVKPNFIPDPVDLLPKNKNSKKDGFLFLGRISQEKGIHDLIATWLKYEIESPLYIVGDGEIKVELEQQTSGNSNIKWIGLQTKNQVYEWFSKVKALVFPSIWFEGFPMTIAESLGMGVPIISSNIGSQGSIVLDQINGLQFEVGNHESLYKKIAMIDSDSELQKDLAKGSRKSYLENYTPEINYQNLINIYNSVL